MGGLFARISMAARAGKFGAVYMPDMNSANYGFKMETTCLNPGVYTRYQVTTVAKRYFLSEQGYSYSEIEGFTNYAYLENLYYQEIENICVFVDGNVILSGYSVEYVGGVVEFAVPLAADNVVTISVKYYTFELIAGFFNWTIDKIISLEEATEFGSGWRSYVPCLRGVSGEAQKFFYSDEGFIDRQGELAIIVLYVDTTNSYRYEGYGYLSGVSTDTPVDTLVKQRISIIGKGTWYYRSN